MWKRLLLNPPGIYSSVTGWRRSELFSQGSFMAESYSLAARRCWGNGAGVMIGDASSHLISSRWVLISKAGRGALSRSLGVDSWSLSPKILSSGDWLPSISTGKSRVVSCTAVLVARASKGRSDGEDKCWSSSSTSQTMLLSRPLAIR